MQETCTLRMYLFSNLPTSAIPYKGLPKIRMLQMRVHMFLNQNEAHLITVIKKLGEKEERLTEVGNPDCDAFTKIEGSMKKHMEQLGENLMKNLFNELQDSKREMEEELNHVMIWTKSYAESVQNTSQEKNQTPNGTYIDFRVIMEETKNAELVEEKEKKLRFRNLTIHGVEKSSSDNKDDAIKSDDIYISNFITALKVTSSVKSASRIGIPAQDKNRPIKVVMNTEDERNMIFSNLKNLKGIPEYKTISVTENYTITERRMIKDWSNKAKKKKSRMNHLIQNLYGECEIFQKNELRLKRFLKSTQATDCN